VAVPVLEEIKQPDDTSSSGPPRTATDPFNFPLRLGHHSLVLVFIATLPDKDERAIQGSLERMEESAKQQNARQSDGATLQRMQDDLNRLKARR
jgi:hypothetical protein